MPNHNHKLGLSDSPLIDIDNFVVQLTTHLVAVGELDKNKEKDARQALKRPISSALAMYQGQLKLDDQLITLNNGQTQPAKQSNFANQMKKVRDDMHRLKSSMKSLGKHPRAEFSASVMDDLYVVADDHGPITPSLISLERQLAACEPYFDKTIERLLQTPPKKSNATESLCLDVLSAIKGIISSDYKKSKNGLAVNVLAMLKDEFNMNFAPIARAYDAIDKIKKADELTNV